MKYATEQQPLLWGVDFTSAPSPKKPIVAVSGVATKGFIQIESYYRWQSLGDYVAWLYEPSHTVWYCGLDIPMGLPIPVVTALNWKKLDWESTYSALRTLGKADFESKLKQYQQRQPHNHKEPRRLCDELAGALSPCKIAYTPTAKMLYEGATHLAKASHISVWPCRPVDNASKHMAEVYPGTLIRELLISAGKQKHSKYKAASSNAQRINNPAHTREWIINALQSSPHITSKYGYSLKIPPPLVKQAIADDEGDTVDALACLLQAAWMKDNQHQLGSLFPKANALEGWIIDPITITNNNELLHSHGTQ